MLVRVFTSLVLLGTLLAHASRVSGNDDENDGEATTDAYADFGRVLGSRALRGWKDTASFKEQKGFKCASEGFHADPKNCLVFYRCIPNGASFNIFKFECGPGTVYDPDTNVCNHPSATKRSECGGQIRDKYSENEIDGGMNHNSANRNNPSTQKSTTRAPVATKKPVTQQHINSPKPVSQKQPHTTTTARPFSYVQWTESQRLTSTTKQQKVTEAPERKQQSVSQSSSSDKCITDGFMADSRNCHKFYRCVANGRGGFTRHEFTCSHNTVWDPEIQGCNHAWATKIKCGESSPAPQKQSQERVSFQESGNKNFEKATSKSRATTKSPSISSTASKSRTTSKISKVTQSSQTTTNQQKPLTTSTTQFVNLLISTTSKPSRVSTVSTTQKKTQNVDRKSSNTQKKTNNKNNSSNRSSNKASSRESSFNCESEGFYGDPNICKKFYRCVDNGNGGYTKHEFQCGDGTVWNQEIQGCDHEANVKDCGGSGSNSNNESSESSNESSETADNESSGTSNNESSGTSNNESSGTSNNESSGTSNNESSGNGSESNSSSSSSNSESNSNSSNNGQSSSSGSNGESSESSSEHSNSSSNNNQSSSSGDDSKCESEGFYGDSKNCKKFYRCVNNGNGGYTRYEFQCGDGTVWNQEIQGCDHEYNVKNCKESSSSSSSSSSQSETSSSGNESNNNNNEESDNNNKEQSNNNTEESNNNKEQSNNNNNEQSSSNNSESQTEANNSSTDSSDKNKESTSSSEKCESEGFYGDSKNCKKFYRCVDNGNGGYTKHEFQCGDGTVWNQEIQGCDHEYNVKTCGSSSGSSSSESSSSSQSSNENSSTSNNNSESNETQSETESNSQPNESSSNGNSNSGSPTEEESSCGSDCKCEASGFYADPSDCKRFYRCVDNGDGGYAKYDFTCGDGTVWNQEIEGCDHEYNVKHCGKSGPGSSSESESNSMESTTSESNESSSTEKTTTEKSSKECSKGSSSNATCTSEGYFGVRENCHKFYRCVDNGDGGYTKYDYVCGEGTAWNQEIQGCDHEYNVDCSGSSSDSDCEESNENETSSESSTTEKTTEKTTTEKSTSQCSKGGSSNATCTSEGYYGVRENCHKFYRCVDNGDGGFTKYDYVCGEGTAWNQEIQGCDHEYNVDCSGSSSDSDCEESKENETSSESSTTEKTTEKTTTEKSSSSCSKGGSSNATCTSEGYYGVRENCHKFYRCVDNGNGGYTKYDYTCGEGTAWNQEIQGCDHEYNVDCSGSSSDSDCEESKENETSSESSTTEKTTEKTTTEKSSSSCSKGGSSNATCTSEGYYGVRENCHKFYRCVDNGDGGFTKYDYVCGEGTAWNQEIQACDHEYNVDCSGSSSDSDCEESKENETSSESSTTEKTTEKTTTEKSSSSCSKGGSSNATCTSEGYYGVREDCHKFYRCVDNGNGGYTKYDYTCGEGTAWNQEIQGCDHEYNVDCSGSSSDSDCEESKENETSSESSTTEKTTEKTTTEKSSSSCSKGGSSNATCTSEGYYGVRENCHKFYRCVDNGNGGYTKYDYTCGEGTAWNQEIQGCDHEYNVDCSGSSSDSDCEESNETSSESSTTEKTTEKTTTEKSTSQCSKGGSSNATCTSEGYYGVREDCHKFYRCVDNGNGGYTKYDFVCGEGTAWSQEIQSCDHEYNVDCSGSSSSDSDCEESKESSTTEKSTEMTTTEKSSSQCSNGGSSNSTCTSEGYYGVREDCHKFYRCVDDGNGGYTKYDFICGEGTAWSQEIQGCDHEYNVDCSGSSSSDSNCEESNESTSESSTTEETTESTSSTSTQSSSSTTKKEEKSECNDEIKCPHAGYFAHPSNCKKFYRCVDWDGNEGKRYSVYHFDCGEGTIWDPALDTCNHEESVYPKRDCSGKCQQSTTEKGETTTETTTQESTTEENEETTTETTTSTEETTEEKTTTEQESTTEEKTTTEQESTTEEKTTTEQESTTEEKTTEQESTTEEKTTTEQESTTEEKTTTEQESTTEEKTTTEQESTTEESTESTTEESTESTTEESTESSTEESTESTTEESTESTTEESTESTTEESTESTTEESTESTTEESTESTTEESTESTTEESTESTTEESTESTTEESTESTTEESTESTTEESTESTTEESTESTTEESTDSTTEGTTEMTTESTKKCPIGELEDDQFAIICPTGFRRHPKYCNLFYQCNEDQDNYDLKVTVFSCPDDTIYDEEQTKCVDEKDTDQKCEGERAEKKTFRVLIENSIPPVAVRAARSLCPTEGHFSLDSEDHCSPAFVKCRRSINTHKLEGMLYQCPKDYIYWPVSRRCEKASRIARCQNSPASWTRRWEVPIERINIGL